MFKLSDPIHKPFKFNIESATSISKHNTFNYSIAPPTNLGKSCHKGCAFCIFSFAREPKPYLRRWDEHVPQKHLSPSGSTIYFESLTRTAEKQINIDIQMQRYYQYTYICLDTCVKYIYGCFSTIHYLYWGGLKLVETRHLITKFPWHHWLFNDNLLETLANASEMLHVWNIYHYLPTSSI